MTSRWQRSTPQGSSPHLTEQSAHAVGGTAIWSCDPRRRGLPPFGALHMAPFARGPESTVFTASLRKSAESAYWPRRGPALGQRCTRAGESLQGDAENLHDADCRSCPNIINHNHLILKMPKDQGKGTIRARKVPRRKWRAHGSGAPPTRAGEWDPARVAAPRRGAALSAASRTLVLPLAFRVAF